MESPIRFNNRYYEQRLTWNSLGKFINEAKKAKVWICHLKNWYTPDEFWEYAKSQGSEEMKEYSRILVGSFKMRDPIAILDQMRAVLNEKEQKLTDFAKRVAIYYKDKS